MRVFAAAFPHQEILRMFHTHASTTCGEKLTPVRVRADVLNGMAQCAR